MSKPEELPRPAQEPRPQFSQDEPMAERLVRVVMNLAAELAVTRERLDTVERLLEERGSVTRQDIEGWQPDATADNERREWRETYVRRIFADLQAEVDAARREAGSD